MVRGTAIIIPFRACSRRWSRTCCRQNSPRQSRSLALNWAHTLACRRQSPPIVIFYLKVRFKFHVMRDSPCSYCCLWCLVFSYFYFFIFIDWIQLDGGTCGGIMMKYNRAGLQRGVRVKIQKPKQRPSPPSDWFILLISITLPPKRDNRSIHQELHESFTRCQSPSVSHQKPFVFHRETFAFHLMPSSPNPP